MEKDLSGIIQEYLDAHCDFIIKEVVRQNKEFKNNCFVISIGESGVQTPTELLPMQLQIKLEFNKNNFIPPNTCIGFQNGEYDSNIVGDIIN